MGELTVDDMPVVEIECGGKAKREIDVAALAARIRELRPSHAILERVGAMPGQGVSSMFSFGRSVGQVEAMLAAIGIPVSYASPVVGKRALVVPAGKDAARLRASQLLPAYSERWRRAKDDGRAEAALIALWGLMNFRELVGVSSA
jgi:crossover junction endodeoxyribonuclease RuvC